MNSVRLRADLALCLAGVIWGLGFVAQKTALDHVGPFTFVAARFFLSAVVVLPLVILEQKSRATAPVASLGGKTLILITALCSAFAIAVLLQQYGMGATSVTNTAFLTGLYIVLVPFTAFLLYRHRLTAEVLGASLLSFLGVWLLSEGSTDVFKVDFRKGDGLIILCAVGFALQVTLMGQIAERVRRPFFLSFVQYVFVSVVASLLACFYENIDVASILTIWIPIVFAGVASGGIAYTLQAVAQQHTPASHAAIILSSEALFGGVGGVWLLHEPLTVQNVAGCFAILAAIALVELSPFWKRFWKSKVFQKL